MTDDALFTMDPIEGDARRSVTELAAIHRDGLPLLVAATGATDPDSVIWRIRSADDLALDSSRRFQVTIRTKSAGGKMAEEWRRLHNDEILFVSYGFFARNPDRITDYVVLSAENLRIDLRERPGCQVRANNSRLFEHHAPGGASFVAIDVRHVRPETVIMATFRIDHDPAPITVQEGLGF